MVPSGETPLFLQRRDRSQQQDQNATASIGVIIFLGLSFCTIATMLRRLPPELWRPMAALVVVAAVFAMALVAYRVYAVPRQEILAVYRGGILTPTGLLRPNQTFLARQEVVWIRKLELDNKHLDQLADNAGPLSHAARMSLLVERASGAGKSMQNYVIRSTKAKPSGMRAAILPEGARYTYFVAIDSENTGSFERALAEAGFPASLVREPLRSWAEAWS